MKKKKKEKEKNKQQYKKKTAATSNNLHLQHRWRCYQTIALNDQPHCHQSQIMPHSNANSASTPRRSPLD